MNKVILALLVSMSVATVSANVPAETKSAVSDIENRIKSLPNVSASKKAEYLKWVKEHKIATGLFVTAALGLGFAGLVKYSAVYPRAAVAAVAGVPAVAAVPEVKDAAGNVVTPAVAGVAEVKAVAAQDEIKEANWAGKVANFAFNGKEFVVKTYNQVKDCTGNATVAKYHVIPAAIGSVILSAIVYDLGFRKDKSVIKRAAKYVFGSTKQAVA